MRRRPLILAAFLLVGAVVNVAVAWGCAAWVPADSVAPISASEEFTRLLKRVPTDQPDQMWIPWDRDSDHSSSGVGVYQERRIAWATKDREYVRTIAGTSLSVFRVRAGLPMLSAQGVQAESGDFIWEQGVWISSPKRLGSATRPRRPARLRSLERCRLRRLSEPGPSIPAAVWDNGADRGWRGGPHDNGDVGG